jgi:hypothetical protein
VALTFLYLCRAGNDVLRSILVSKQKPGVRGAVGDNYGLERLTIDTDSGQILSNRTALLIRAFTTWWIGHQRRDIWADEFSGAHHIFT